MRILNCYKLLIELGTSRSVSKVKFLAREVHVCVEEGEDERGRRVVRVSVRTRVREREGERERERERERKKEWVGIQDH